MFWCRVTNFYLSLTNSIVDIKIPDSGKCQVFSLPFGDEIIVKLSRLSSNLVYSNFISTICKQRTFSLSLSNVSISVFLSVISVKSVLMFDVINNETETQYLIFDT